MGEHPDRAALQQALARLTKIGAIPSIGRSLKRNARALGRLLRESVVSEIPAFSRSGNPEVLPDLDRHGAEHLTELCRLLSGGSVGDFEFIRAHARRRAEQRFPLEAILHAYRCGHKIFARGIRDATHKCLAQQAERATGAIADFAIEYTNIASTALASEYVSQTRLLAEAEGDRRNELLRILTSGFDESDGRVARLLKYAGFHEQRLVYCVVLARSIDPVEMENHARTQRIVESIGQALAPLGTRALIGIRNSLVIAVVSSMRRQSGWTAPQTRLARRIYPALLGLGPAVLMGLSNDQPSTALIPRGVREASVALECARVTDRVVQFVDLPVRALILHRASDYIQTAPPTWFAPLRAADQKTDGALVNTLRACADADLNILKAARILSIHPNTVYARLQRINALTGLRSQRYHDLTELLLTVDSMSA